MIAILIAGMFATPLYAADEIPDVDMHAMAKEVQVLQRYMFSEAEFSAPQNEAAIRGAFPNLDKHLARLHDKVFADETGLQSNTALLADQVADAGRAFQEGNKAYSRYVLVSSLQLCIACHTRSASPDFILPAAELKGASELEKAEYYFATRQFELGRGLYEKFLAQSGKGESPQRVGASALALAVYYARVKMDPRGGADYFSGLAGNKKFSAQQRAGFAAWAAAFREWSKNKGKYEDSPSAAHALQAARKILRERPHSPAREVQLLRASASLHAALEAPGEKSPEKAAALLELGRVYEQLDFPLYYRFGDMYLKACISEYPKSKAAQNCYRALDAAIKQRLVGGGANIEEVNLFRWKKLAY